MNSTFQYKGKLIHVEVNSGPQSGWLLDVMIEYPPPGVRGYIYEELQGTMFLTEEDILNYAQDEVEEKLDRADFAFGDR